MELAYGILPIKEVECDKCGYKWLSKTKLASVSCPNCMGKVKLLDKKKVIDETLKFFAEEGKKKKSKYDYLDPIFDEDI